MQSNAPGQTVESMRDGLTLVRQDELLSIPKRVGGTKTESRAEPTQRENGVPSNLANAMRPEDAPVHNWYRFVLSFPPHLVAEYLDRFNVSEGATVLDPFCGTGTTLVESKKRGVRSIGLEAMPMTAFAATTKVDWSCDPQALLEHAEHVASVALKRLAAQGITDEPFNDDIGQMGLRQLSPDHEKLVFKDAISPLPLHKSLVLLDAIYSEYHASMARHERLAFASTVVGSASNLKFGPEVGVGRVKRDAPVIAEWMSRVRRMVSDLRQFATNDTESTVKHADSRSVDRHVVSGSVDAVITSPPYPNEKDYTRTVRLEAVLLGFIRDRTALRELKDCLLRSNTRNVFKGDNDGELVRDNKRIMTLAQRIESKRIELGKTSGFEKRYAQVTLEYFGGMLRHLRSLKPALRSGAKLAYVVGDQASYFRVPIPTGEILQELAEAEGYAVVGRDLFRTRFATVTKEPLREEVLILRAP